MQRPLLIVILGALALGIGFRFVGLADKLYTNDEATTSVHVSGHTIAEYLAVAAEGRIRTTGDAMRFQTVDPSTGVADVVASLALEDPQHPPLYYVLERAWERSFGSSIAARRSMSAVIGLFVLGAAFFFGRTLLRSDAGGGVFAAVVATSPFHVLYAQQAREYGLWTFFVLLSTTMLLRALESEAPLEWAGYALATALGLYTDTLFLLTLPAQACLLLAYRARFLRQLASFALAAGTAVLAFAPWLVVLYRGRTLVTNNAYFAAPLPLGLYLLKWLFNVGAVFFDLDYVVHGTAIVLLPLLAVVAAGFVLLLREADRRVALFAYGSFAVTALAFVVPDLVHHESRSTAARYLMPAWLACEVSVSYVVLRLVRRRGARSRALGTLTLATFVVAGLVSSWVGIHQEFWWGDASIAPIGPIARAVRAARKPVVVAFNDDHSAWDFSPVELADAVSPEVRLVLLGSGSRLPKPQDAGTVFVLDPSARFLERLQRDGWHASLTYRFETKDVALRSLRERASASRAAAGSVDPPASLWELR